MTITLPIIALLLLPCLPRLVQGMGAIGATTSDRAELTFFLPLGGDRGRHLVGWATGTGTAVLSCIRLVYLL